MPMPRSGNPRRLPLFPCRDEAKTEVGVRVHHLNCGTMCPLGGRLMDGMSRDLGPARLVCHCLLIETEAGLVLVDTGLGMRDVRFPHPRLSRFYRNLLRPRLDPDETAVRQVERLGFAAADVRHILLTHLDFDHAGGLEDFPLATVHLLAAELEAARRRNGPVARGRYRPMQWDEGPKWRTYPIGGGEPWFGFEAVRDLAGLPPEVLLVPLAGHSWGHTGVAIDTDEGWLLHAGDAYFFRGEIGSPRRRCPPGLRAYQRLMEVDRRARLRNQDRLRRLSLEQRGQVRILCGHDAVEFDRWRGQPRAAAAPARAAQGA